MPTLEDYLRPLPPAPDPGLVALELGQDPPSLPEPPVLLARLVQVVESIGPVHEASTAERPVYEAVFYAAQIRIATLDRLAAAAITIFTPEIEAAMLEVLAAKAQLSQGLAATPHTVDGAHVRVPLGFVGQLRLEELAPLDTEGRLPPAGLLSFFVRQDIQVGDHGDLFQVAARVLFTVGEVAPLTPPPEVQDFDRHKAIALRLSRELPLPPPQQAYGVGLLAEESSLYDTVYGQRTRSPLFGALGLGRAAYYRGLPPPGETLLLQLGSGGGTKFSWGDASSIFFLIADAALRKHDFAKALCVADEC